MKLPNADQAVVDLFKLTGYIFNQNHLRGRHKARAFQSKLGLTADQAEWFRNRLLDAAQHNDAQLIIENQYGRQYMVEFPMFHLKQRHLIRSIWIIKSSEGFPRFVTCYIKKDGNK